MAMTWNKDYFEAEAKALGREIHLVGYNPINCPEAGPLGRTPWGGCQSEAFSRDPYLSGVALAKTIDGMNSAGTIHELYLWPFQDGVRAGMAAVMCAMSRVNNSQSCENSHIVTELLEAELGFPGMVFPGVNSQTTSYDLANAGQDYGSSSYWTSQPSEAGSTDYRDVRSNPSALIREVSAASLVLLKNNVTTSGGPPLDRPKSINVFGAHAGPAMAGPNQAFSVQGSSGPTYRGHLALTTRAAADGSMIRWILNNTYTSSSSGMGVGSPPSTGGMGGSSNFSYSSTSASENIDQYSLVRSVASEWNVLTPSSSLTLSDAWVELENVKAVQCGGMPGQESGNAIADVLYGDVNPSGKLINTIAKNESNYPVQLCYTANCDFDEGVYVDYRHFDRCNVTPRYSFGHGLSYTTFEYGDVTDKKTNETALSATYPSGPMAVGGKTDLFDTVLNITTTLSNTGSRSGAEVAQLYVSYPAVANQPMRQLRGFGEVPLDKGAKSTVTFEVRRKDVSHWDTVAKEWTLAKGTYTFFVGSRSRDLGGSVAVEI
ncbi:putative beta-glucosidase D [Phyllosticta citriasiana]|uniref:putative beta-glucosidase D n=1 Tax=Phyllosticta citriasiana TaxID=595635 RepID=UPI0030FD9814